MDTLIALTYLLTIIVHCAEDEQKAGQLISHCDIIVFIIIYSNFIIVKMYPNQLCYKTCKKKPAIYHIIKQIARSYKHTSLPGLTSRKAASAAWWAARTTSALRPSTLLSCISQPKLRIWTHGSKNKLRIQDACLTNSNLETVPNSINRL